ncbi:MAG: hypothetical protein ABIC04_03145 [Nanoarchaeota archaeon]
MNEEIRKKLKNQFEKTFDINENSDIIVHEKRVKDEDFRTLKKKLSNK